MNIAKLLSALASSLHNSHSPNGMDGYVVSMYIIGPALLHSTLRCGGAWLTIVKSYRHTYHTKIDGNDIYARFRADLVVSVFPLLLLLGFHLLLLYSFFLLSSIFFSSVGLCVCFDYVDKS